MKTFQIELLSQLTLPALSERILWLNYNESFGYIHSIGDDFGHINTKIRDNLLGGPTIPFFRHIELDDIGSKNFDKSVYYTQSGERYKVVKSYDFNG